MKIYLFNPDSDMALAADKPNYTPPANIRRMIGDLSMLPVWYAAPGSMVLSDSEHDRRHLAELKTRLDIPAELVSSGELPKVDAPDVCPWGWNMALRNRLVRLGIDAGRLPSDGELTVCRRMSSRSVLADCGLLRDLQTEVKHCDVSLFSAESVDECRRIAGGMPHGGVVFKKPWSSSGKGLLWCRDGRIGERDANWCRKAIDEQGLLVASPIYNKVSDFAMEFHADGQGCVSFAGYSLFHADSAGRYKGNVLASDSTILHELTRYVPQETLLQVRDRITAFVSSLGHRGYMGVDMLVYEEEDGGYGVCPAVEHNLRMTMGMVCRLFADRFLDSDSVGTFEVRHFDDAAQAADFCHRQRTAYPLHTTDSGRIRSGFLNLTAVGPECQNVAFVNCGTRIR